MDRLTNIITAILSVLGISFMVFKYGQREGAKDLSRRLTKADSKTAKETEAKVDEAQARNRADARPVDDRLHSKGRLRD